ncbi:MAG: hypothetical protein K2X87_31120 [Gemmataceae bacterium]|nr:hypothetical protein [Gemmataceae bacterium]
MSEKRSRNEGVRVIAAFDYRAVPLSSEAAASPDQPGRSANEGIRVVATIDTPVVPADGDPGESPKPAPPPDARMRGVLGPVYHARGLPLDRAVAVTVLGTPASAPVTDAGRVQELDDTIDGIFICTPPEGPPAAPRGTAPSTEARGIARWVGRFMRRPLFDRAVIVALMLLTTLTCFIVLREILMDYNITDRHAP